MSKLTLDEAIKHCLDVAEEQELSLNDKEMYSEMLGDDYSGFEEGCRECAADHRQLAEWLTELKAYKRLRICCNCRHYVGGTTHYGECHVTSDIEPCVVAAAEPACDTFFNYKICLPQTYSL